MRAHFKPGRVCGVELGVHLSRLTVALLITLSLAEHFRPMNSGRTEGRRTISSDSYEWR